jgi:hypothetical protein
MLSCRTIIDRYRRGDAFEKVFAPTDQTDADGFRNSQTNWWGAVVAEVMGLLQSQGLQPSGNAVLQQYQEAIREKGDSLFVIFSREADIRVSASVPLLEGLTESNIDPKETWLWAAAIIYWFGTTVRSRGLNELLQDPRLLRGMIEVSTPNGATVDDFRSKLTSAIDEADRNKSTIARKVEEIEALVNKAREKAVFSSASDLWSRKAMTHTNNFAMGFVFVVAWLVILAGTIYRSGPQLWNELPKNSNGEFTYLATLIAVFAFIALAWIFRMLGRFVTENFYLAADARQRQMILQTFLNLVGTPEAQMKDAERVLILNALFRALPGQSGDDPAPSSLFEMMKDAFSKSVGK